MYAIYSIDNETYDGELIVWQLDGADKVYDTITQAETRLLEINNQREDIHYFIGLVRDPAIVTEQLFDIYIVRTEIDQWDLIKEDISINDCLAHSSRISKTITDPSHHVALVPCKKEDDLPAEVRCREKHHPDEKFCGACYPQG